MWRCIGATRWDNGPLLALAPPPASQPILAIANCQRKPSEFAARYVDPPNGPHAISTLFTKLFATSRCCSKLDLTSLNIPEGLTNLERLCVKKFRHFSTCLPSLLCTLPLWHELPSAHSLGGLASTFHRTLVLLQHSADTSLLFQLPL